MSISKATNSMLGNLGFDTSPSTGGGMGAITNSEVLFPAIANGWGNSTPGAQGTGGKGTGNVVNAQPINTVEPVWADDFNWNTATLADAHRKLSTDKYGMVNYAKYSDADAQRLLDSERSSMASTQQPAPQATGGMGTINPSVFPAIANGMFGNANTGGTATSSFGWQNVQPSQGTGGKGVGNVVNAQPIQSAASLLQPYYSAQQAPTLMSATSGNRAGQPYVYGNLGLTSSDYSLWGSRGNPYLVAGPTYTPGSGRPINPQPIAPIAPPSNGGDSDYPTAPGTGGDSNTGFRDPFNDTPFNAKSFGQLYPGLGLAAGLVHGRVDAPFGEGYARLPWYEGSAGGGYGYTEEGYDQYAPGDSDRGIYDAATGERTWDDSFDDYNTNDRWAQTGIYEGIGNIFGGRTWDGLETETYGTTTPVSSTPRTFGDPNSALAQEARAGIASEKARVATNIAINSAKAAQAAIAAENPAQAARDAAYVGTASDGYAATAKRYGTTPGSEQTAMLAEQDMGMSGPATVAEAIAEGKPFGKEGDDSWSPNGKDVFHGPGHNWNTPDSENTAPPGTVTPPSSGGGSSSDGGAPVSDGTSEGAAATHGTTAGSEQSNMLAEQDRDFNDDSDSGGGDSGGGGGCFTADTLVTDSTGKDKAISEYKIGDSVMSIDGKTANKVKYVEVMSWDDDYELYSPTTKLEPFITKNHPIKVEGKWVSADLDYTERNHPWIDAVDIDTPVIKKGKGIVVYNLWVDGDNTYTVNGYDTETLIGDGGVVRQGLEYGNINMEDFKNIIKSSLSSTPEVTYGMHILNMALAFITNKKANGFILDVVLGKRKFRPLDLLIYSVGKTAMIFKNKTELQKMELTNKIIPQRR